MCVNTIGALFLNKCVASVVKFRNISAKILNERKFTTWMLPFIPVSVKYKVVKEHQFLAPLDLNIHLLCCVALP